MDDINQTMDAVGFKHLRLASFVSSIMHQWYRPIGALQKMVQGFHSLISCRGIDTKWEVSIVYHTVEASWSFLHMENDSL